MPTSVMIEAHSGSTRNAMDRYNHRIYTQLYIGRENVAGWKERTSDRPPYISRKSTCMCMVMTFKWWLVGMSYGMDSILNDRGAYTTAQSGKVIVDRSKLGGCRKVRT
jgi:hypothetical protein